MNIQNWGNASHQIHIFWVLDVTASILMEPFQQSTWGWFLHGFPCTCRKKRKEDLTLRTGCLLKQGWLQPITQAFEHPSNTIHYHLWMKSLQNYVSDLIRTLLPWFPDLSAPLILSMPSNTMCLHSQVYGIERIPWSSNAILNEDRLYSYVWEEQVRKLRKRSGMIGIQWEEEG